MRLHRRSWEPEAPDRVVLLVHGYAEHSGRYEELARWFAARGCLVHAYDHRGHGRSEGRRAHVETFQEFVADLRAFASDLSSQHPERPFHLIGHSMGGLITAAFLAEGGEAVERVESAVLSAPLLDAGAVSSSRRFMAGVLRHLLPTFALGSGIDSQGLSRDASVIRAYLEDPLIFGNMTVSLACELLEAVHLTVERAEDVKVPLLVLHGDADPICLSRGSETFAARVAGSRLQLYPGLRHEIFNEPEREDVYRDVLGWLEGKRG